MSTFNNLGTLQLQQLMAAATAANTQSAQSGNLAFKVSDPTNVANTQAAYDSALSLDSLLSTTGNSSGLNLGGLTTMMPQMGLLGNFYGSAGLQPGMSSFGFGQMPGVDFTGLGMAPLDLTSTLFGMAGLGFAGAAASGADASGAGGITDMNLLLGLFGLPVYGTNGAAAAEQSTSDAQLANVVKKLPIISAKGMENSLSKSYEIPLNASQKINVSLMSGDDSGLTLLNSVYRDPAQRSEVAQRMSSTIDTEVRLAERRDYKTVAAETIANELLTAYGTKHPEALKDEKHKQQLLSGLKKICLNETETKDSIKGNTSVVGMFGGMTGGYMTSTDPDIMMALQAIPMPVDIKNDHNYYTEHPYDGTYLHGGRNTGVSLIQSATDDLAAQIKNNMIKRNSIG